jgi:hypothetical protein
MCRQCFRGTLSVQFASANMSSWRPCITFEAVSLAWETLCRLVMSLSLHVKTLKSAKVRLFANVPPKVASLTLL